MVARPHGNAPPSSGCMPLSIQKPNAPPTLRRSTSEAGGTTEKARLLADPSPLRTTPPPRGAQPSEAQLCDLVVSFVHFAGGGLWKRSGTDRTTRVPRSKLGRKTGPRASSPKRRSATRPRRRQAGNPNIPMRRRSTARGESSSRQERSTASRRTESTWEVQSGWRSPRRSTGQSRLCRPAGIPGRRRIGQDGGEGPRRKRTAPLSHADFRTDRLSIPSTHPG
jgi:hypothetical protein